MVVSGFRPHPRPRLVVRRRGLGRRRHRRPVALVALACAGTVVLVRRDAFRTMFADGTRGWRRGIGL